MVAAPTPNSLMATNHLELKWVILAVYIAKEQDPRVRTPETESLYFPAAILAASSSLIMGRGTYGVSASALPSRAAALLGSRASAAL